MTEKRAMRRRGHVHVGRDVARDDAVHLDVLLAPLVAEGLGQLAERTLGRGVRRDREATLYMSPRTTIARCNEVNKKARAIVRNRCEGGLIPSSPVVWRLVQGNEKTISGDDLPGT